MSAHSFSDLAAHAGHTIECVTYGSPAVNAAVECVTCSEVLVDFEAAGPDRSDRTVWRITAADLDENAKRELTDDELERFGRSFDNTSVNECVEAMLEQIVPDLYADDDDDGTEASE